MSLDRENADELETDEHRRKDDKDFIVDEEVLKNKIDEIKRKMREGREITLEEKQLFHLYLKSK